MGYASDKKWRLSHTEKRNKQRKRYYAKNAVDVENSRTMWTIEEMDLITDSNRPLDRALAKKLGRSVQAVQVKRSKINR